VLRRKILTMFLLLSLIFVFFASGQFYTLNANESDRPRNIILIGWDGAQRNHIKECISRNELPDLEKLSSEGTLVAIDVLRVTDTKAGWTQILTGYEPEITKVFDNKDYKPIPAGLTVFERLEKYFGSGNIITGAIVGKGDNVGADKGLPFYNAKNSMDFFINNLGTNDVTGYVALNCINRYKDKPFFFFVHFADVDTNGHKYGENSREYNNALISSDYWTGKIISMLKDLNLYDKTLIYITADHGFDEGTRHHKDAPYVFLATNDKKVIRRGLREDIAPTIMDRFGLDLEKISPPLDGHSLLKPYNPPIW